MNLKVYNEMIYLKSKRKQRNCAANKQGVWNKKKTCYNPKLIQLGHDRLYLECRLFNLSYNNMPFR